METVNNAQLLEMVDENASPTTILRAQILLDRAHFSPGEIDARYGRNMRNAIIAYQQANHVERSGVIDVATWTLLNKDDLPVLSNYTITSADTDGPFAAIPSTMLAKSKLTALGYSSSTELLGEKFHINPTLLQQLNDAENLNRVVCDYYSQCIIARTDTSSRKNSRGSLGCLGILSRCIWQHHRSIPCIHWQSTRPTAYRHLVNTRHCQESGI